MIVEVVAFNYRSAQIAATAGADRIELCDNFYEGGTTPSHAAVTSAVDTLGIPVFPMVRPRGGDFLYHSDELLLMEKEIRFFKEVGCKGIVLGCLQKDGTVDKEVVAKFVEMAYPMEVTFHRAFDRTRNMFEALEDVISCGCKRILTSGGRPIAADSADVIRQLVIAAGDKVSIIAGGGVNSNNIDSLVQTGATEFHTPARKMTATGMEYINDGMNENLEYPLVNEAELMKISGIVKNKTYTSS